MNFGEAISTGFTKYADFTGRARRSEYWWWLLFVVSVTVVTVLINFTLYVIAVIGLLLPGIAVSVRRLHDTGRSGWFYFIVLVPLVGGIILLVWMATEGNPGPNQYGDPTSSASSFESGL